MYKRGSVCGCHRSWHSETDVLRFILGFRGVSIFGSCKWVALPLLYLRVQCFLICFACCLLPCLILVTLARFACFLSYTLLSVVLLLLSCT